MNSWSTSTTSRVGRLSNVMHPISVIKDTTRHIQLMKKKSVTFMWKKNSNYAEGSAEYASLKRWDTHRLSCSNEQGHPYMLTRHGRERCLHLKQLYPSEVCQSVCERENNSRDYPSEKRFPSSLHKKIPEPWPLKEGDRWVSFFWPGPCWQLSRIWGGKVVCVFVFVCVETVKGQTFHRRKDWSKFIWTFRKHTRAAGLQLAPNLAFM